MFRFHAARDVWSRIFFINLLKVVIIVKILQKALHCSNGKGMNVGLLGWCYLGSTTLQELQI